jgi:hypothetical protein
MPYWWGREHWQRQFPADVYADCSITMKSIKDGNTPNASFRYCPDWTAPRKSGQPKKDERRKSGVETALEKNKGGRKKTLKRVRCQISGKWNHKTQDCFVLTKKPKNDSDEMSTDDVIDETSVERERFYDPTTHEELQEGTAD